MDVRNLAIALALAYLLGALTGPFWTAGWRRLLGRRRTGFEHYYPDDFRPRKRRRRRAEPVGEEAVKRVRERTRKAKPADNPGDQQKAA